MMKAGNGPETPATKYLRQHDVTYSSHFYEYEDHGGTSISSRKLGVSEHVIVKTLIMQDELGKPIVVLMHGDCKVSTKELARQAGCKRIEPCRPDVANRHTGFLVGGTSPFGIKKKMPIYIQRTILDLPQIYINGGRRGYLICLSPLEFTRLLDFQIVDVALM
jgi:Cys-tRNA(Pro) deacylase